MKPVIINTLGEFSIAYGDNIISEKDRRSKKMWTMLKYLTAFKDRGVTQSELIEILWGDEELNNPAGALKTQLHRLRAALEALGLEDDKELVVSFFGTYAFNDKLEYVIDAAVFEDNFKKSLSEDISEKEQIGFVKNAFELYHGDFLKNSAEEKWVIPIRLYYHSIYIRVVHRLTEALFRYKRYAELIDICQKALQIESFDQKIHLLLIKALVATGDREAARKHYKYVIDMLYNRMGINPSAELQEIYKETIDEEGDYANDLEAVKKKFMEEAGGERKGAFFCEREFFKSIYRLKMRDAERSKQPMQICLVTISGAGGAAIEPKTIADEMKRLHDCIMHSLRNSDVFARYNVTQYVIMLPTATDETCKMVIDRIIERFKVESKGFMLDINYKHVVA